MFDIKRFGKRVMMTGLFFAALLTTAETVTGLNVKAIVTYPNLNYSPGNDIGDSQSNELTATSIVNMFTLSNKHTLATAVKPQTLAESENWSKYPSKKVIATGYTAGIESTGKKPGHPLYGITFSGVKVKRDLYSTIAADPNVFPLGTILYIPDYGFGVVADTGSKIKGNVIDLYFESVEDVYNEWGKRTVEVFIIEEGNGYVTEEDLQALNENEAMQVFRQDFLKKAEE